MKKTYAGMVKKTTIPPTSAITASGIIKKPTVDNVRKEKIVKMTAKKFITSTLILFWRGLNRKVRTAIEMYPSANNERETTSPANIVNTIAIGAPKSDSEKARICEQPKIRITPPPHNPS